MKEMEKDQMSTLFEQVSKARCPECGMEVILSKALNPQGFSANPVVICADMGHWGGLLSECNDKKKTIFVLAGTFQEAKEFAFKKGYSYQDMIYVNDIEKIKGFRKENIYILNSALTLDDYGDIVKNAKIQEFKFEFEWMKIK